MSDLRRIVTLEQVLCCAAVIAKRPPGVLKGFGTDEMHADALQKALQVLTVRDLALYPPYLAAKKLLAMAYMPDRLPGVDSEAPSELLPKVCSRASVAFELSGKKHGQNLTTYRPYLGYGLMAASYISLVQPGEILIIYFA